MRGNIIRPTGCCGGLQLPPWLTILSLIISAATACAVIQITLNLFPGERTRCAEKAQPQWQPEKPIANEDIRWQAITYTPTQAANVYAENAND